MKKIINWIFFITSVPFSLILSWWNYVRAREEVISDWLLDEPSSNTKSTATTLRKRFN